MILWQQYMDQFRTLLGVAIVAETIDGKTAEPDSIVALPVKS